MQNRTARVAGIWAKMQDEKGDLIRRSEAYARWTVPAVMPPDGYEKTEQLKGNVTIGARLVNHLANKIVDVLFPTSRPFFTVALTAQASLDIKKEIGPEQEGKLQEAIRDATSNLEAIALRGLNLTAYRPTAILACKHLIITGNALLRRMPTGERVLYPVNRYGVHKDILGKEYEVVLSDKKLFSTFNDETKALIAQAHKSVKDEDEVELFTHYKKEGKRWHVTQEADGVALDTDIWMNADDYDLLVLGWTQHPGEHYSRGLVEDFAATFHNVDVTNEAIIDLMAVIADIKFFVRPGSPLSADIASLNSAPRGSYFPGSADDITVPEVKARGDLSTLIDLVSKWEQELSQAFLVSQVRDAERVTAAEIRMIANELESAFGGLYSQLAQSWQQKEAEFAIAQVDIAKELGGSADSFEVLVTTGLESLSREGQIDNLRLAISDLQMLDVVPAEILQTLNAPRFAKFVFTNRSVDINAFLNTPEEMQALQDQQLAQAGRLQEQQSQANVAEHAGKKAIDNQA